VIGPDEPSSSPQCPESEPRLRYLRHYSNSRISTICETWGAIEATVDLIERFEWDHTVK